MRLRTIYSPSRRIMLRGNSEVDYDVYLVRGIGQERIGFALDTYATVNGWRFMRQGEDAVIKARTLRQLLAAIEAEYV